MKKFGIKAMTCCFVSTIALAGGFAFPMYADASAFQGAGISRTMNEAKMLETAASAQAELEAAGQAEEADGQTADESTQTVEESGQNSEESGQAAEESSQTAEESNQTVEVSGQAAEVSGQAAEVSGQAAEVSGQTVEVTAGIDAQLKEEAESAESVESAESAEDKGAIKEFSAGIQSEISDIEVDVKKSEFVNLAIAQVDNYVNIRETPGEDGEVLGKLYSDSAAKIESVDGDWYKVTSGTVTGYIKKDYLATGKEAEVIADQVAKKTATINTVTLNVRADVSTDSEIQAQVPEGQTYEVVEEKDGWVKIAVDNETSGYVSTDYVKVESEFTEAESKEEEAARLAYEEELRRQAEEEAKRAAEEAAREEAAAAAQQQAAAAAGASSSNAAPAQSAAQQQPAAQPAAPAPAAQPSGETSGTRSAIVNYALQFVGYPYVYGGTSLTGGADCSGFTMSVMADNGISIPRDSRSQAAGGREVSLDAIQPGDLLFYSNGSTINHVAMYIGNGQVVHASNPETGIKTSNAYYRTPVKAVSYID